MGKYKLLKKKDGYSDSLVEGEVYDKTHRCIFERKSVASLVVEDPDNWEKVDDDFFGEAYASLCEMQKVKNERYGESAIKPLDIFAKHHPYGSRLDEKLARVKNSDKIRKNDVADLIGGLMLICKANDWRDFSDLID